MTAMAGMGGPAGLMADRAAVDWLILAALLLIFGLTTFTALMLPAEIDRQALPSRFSIVVRLSASVQLVFVPLVLIVNVAGMAEVRLRAAIPLVPQVLRETHFGHVWLAAAPLAVLLAALAWAPSRREPARTSGLALISAALLMLWAASGHAVGYGRIAIGVYFIHEAAVGLWLGALVGLWLVADLGDRVVERNAPKVSRLAGWCVGIIVLSGAYAAYDGLGLSIGYLLYSGYGRTLLVKVALFAVVASIGGYNRYRLMPRSCASAASRRALLRNVRIESMVLALVLALSAILANTAPPHRGTGSNANSDARAFSGRTPRGVFNRPDAVRLALGVNSTAASPVPGGRVK
jgi:putative copper resistance protein D